MMTLELTDHRWLKIEHALFVTLPEQSMSKIKLHLHGGFIWYNVTLNYS